MVSSHLLDLIVLKISQSLFLISLLNIFYEKCFNYISCLRFHTLDNKCCLDKTKCCCRLTRLKRLYSVLTLFI